MDQDRQSAKKKVTESEEYFIHPNNVNESTIYNEEEENFLDNCFSERKQLGTKFFIIMSTIICLLYGRFSVPDNEPLCVVDRLMDAFVSVNYFILNNSAWRNGLQIACSAFMDVMYLSTAGYWVLYGTSSRLILTTLLFYAGRIFVQQIWFSPFPAGFWWYDPGFPSLVVPYGRGSDFFFSGHIGFVTICASEWFAHKKKLIGWLIVLGGFYTAFILLAYQVHYSIDIFTGLFFAHWCWLFFDRNKEVIDSFFIKLYVKIYCATTHNQHKKKMIIQFIQKSTVS